MSRNILNQYNKDPKMKMWKYWKRWILQIESPSMLMNGKNQQKIAILLKLINYSIDPHQKCNNILDRRRENNVKTHMAQKTIKSQ